MTGDLVRLQEKVVFESVKGNYSSKQVFERGSVHKFAEKLPDGILVFDSGLKLPETDGRIAQGYVSTSIPAQGMTADRVWAYESSISAKALATCQSLYVVATRHQQEFKLFTEDAKMLEVAASRLGDRLSAIELVRGQRPLEVVQTATKTRIGTTTENLETAKTPENKSVDWGHLIPNTRESALDKIEMESSRRESSEPRLAPVTKARILPEKALERDRPKRRTSALDEIELANPDRGALKKKKEKTFAF